MCEYICVYEFLDRSYESEKCALHKAVPVSTATISVLQCVFFYTSVNI